MLNWATIPGVAGVFFEPYTIKATNGFWSRLVAVFNDTASKDDLHGFFDVPQNYVAGTGANLVIVWTTTATSGDVEFDFDYRAVGGNDSESLDQATAQESVGTNDTAPSATDERMELTIALTDANLAAGDTVEWVLYRDGTDGGDTIAAAIQVHDALFEYADA